MAARDIRRQCGLRPARQCGTLYRGPSEAEPLCREALGILTATSGPTICRSRTVAGNLSVEAELAGSGAAIDDGGHLGSRARG